MKRLVFIEEIDFKGSPKVRAGLVSEVVADYGERYRKREDMPMPIIGDTGATGLVCIDGMHRLHALKKNGQKAVQCEVIKCTLEEALKQALGANDTHGLRRSNDDKRRCVASALVQWPDKSNLAISQLAHVDDKTVASVRKEMEKAGEVDKSVTRKGTDGRQLKPREQKPKANDLVDCTGFTIPKEIRGLWEEGLAVDSLLDGISAAKCAVVNAQKEKDILFVEVNFSAAQGDLQKAYTAVQCARPHAVCPVCNGHPETQEKGCAMCKGRGFISKFRWETVVPDELKKLRRKVVAAEAKEAN